MAGDLAGTQIVLALPPPPDLQRCLHLPARDISSTRCSPKLARCSRRYAAHEGAALSSRASISAAGPAGALHHGGLARLGVDNLLACPGRPHAEPARAHGRVFERAMKNDADIALACAQATDPRAASRPGALHSRRGADLWGGVGAPALPACPACCRGGWTTPSRAGWWPPKYRLYDHVITISEAFGRCCWARSRARKE